MTSTANIVREMTENSEMYDVLSLLNREGDMTRNDIETKTHGNIEDIVERLDHLALVDHIYTKDGCYYRISSRGIRIIEMMAT